jgi:phosphoribosylglycinamide formyltransferase-1
VSLVSRRIAVLISGRGTNLQAIIGAIAEGRLEATLAVVISNRADAQGLERARRAGVDTLCLSHRDYPTRSEHEQAIVRELTVRDVSLVCLAGFMRIVGPDLLNAFPNAILNVHPALLPAFPGVDAQQQAWTHGVKVSGATVHFVDDQLDAGPIILQACVPVRDDETPEALAARILQEEHRLYPKAIQIVLDGTYRIDGRRVVLK